MHLLIYIMFYNVLRGLLLIFWKKCFYMTCNMELYCMIYLISPKIALNVHIWWYLLIITIHFSTDSFAKNNNINTLRQYNCLWLIYLNLNGLNKIIIDLLQVNSETRLVNFLSVKFIVVNKNVDAFTVILYDQQYP